MSRLAAAAILAIAGLLVPVASAAACVLDSVPSMSLNGVLAVTNKRAPANNAALKIWAPFVFTRKAVTGEVMNFAESKREVAKSLTRQAMQRAPRWWFGDSTRPAFGWHVRHIYRRPGTYRVTVQAYDRGTKRWYPFDDAVVTVSKR